MLDDTAINQLYDEANELLSTVPSRSEWPMIRDTDIGRLFRLQRAARVLEYRLRVIQYQAHVADMTEEEDSLGPGGGKQSLGTAIAARMTADRCQRVADEIDECIQHVGLFAEHA